MLEELKVTQEKCPMPIDKPVGKVEKSGKKREKAELEIRHLG